MLWAWLLAGPWAGAAGEGLSHPDGFTSHVLSLSYNSRASVGMET